MPSARRDNLAQVFMRCPVIFSSKLPIAAAFFKAVRPALILLVSLEVFTGCRDAENSYGIGDELWAKGHLRFIICAQHFVPNGTGGWGYHEESVSLDRVDWSLVVLPFPDNSGHRIIKDKFAEKHASGGIFSDSSIAGCDLMIHEVWDLGPNRQNRLFDPNTHLDISEPFPPAPAICALNRSRTACLTLSQGQAVIYDVLSTRSSEPKIIFRPAWTALLDRSQAVGREERLVLTEDAQHLVLSPDNRMELVSKGRLNWAPRTNLNVEAYSANGDKQVLPIPLDRNNAPLNAALAREAAIVDAEWVNGEILLFSTQEVDRANALQGIEMKVMNMKGEILHEGKINGLDVAVLWNPAQHETVGLPNDYSGTAPGTELQMWNYDSNTVQNITLRRK